MNAQVKELSNIDNPFGASVVARPTGLEQAVIQREVTEVQTMALMAKRFPRDPVVAMDRILQACARPTLAEAAVYEYAKGGSTVSGPSIRMAEAIAQNWGNILTGVDIIAGDERKSECIAYAWDMETGARDQKRFTVRHWRDTKSGGYALKDERDIYELCANMGARRKRACILAVIPGDVVEAAVQQCEVTLKTKIEITPDYIKSLGEAFEKFGVTHAMIEKVIQRRLDTLTPALAMRLKKIYASLKDGMSKVDDWFDVEPDGEEPPAGRTSGNEGVKAAVRGRTIKPAAATSFVHGDSAAPYADETVALLAIDGAPDRDEALAVATACQDQPFHKAIRDAVDKRFPIGG